MSADDDPVIRTLQFSRSSLAAPQLLAVPGAASLQVRTVFGRALTNSLISAEAV